MTVRPVTVQRKPLRRKALSNLHRLHRHVVYFLPKNGDRYKRRDREKFAKLPVQPVQAPQSLYQCGFPLHRHCTGCTVGESLPLAMSFTP